MPSWLDHTVTTYTLVSWAGLLLTLLAEHLLLTRVYGKPSSITRLMHERSDSARTDILIAVINSVFFASFGAVRSYALYFFIPGVAYLGVLLLQREIGFDGVMPWLVPDHPVLAVMVWLVLMDLTIYIAHWSLHRIPGLWRFHQLHHSATEMNIITGQRLAMGEHAINALVSFTLLYALLGLAAPSIIMTVLIIRAVIDRIQHSDLPWDYGPLNYLIASPRFHRMHHSSHPEDYDTNFGNILSIWDYLFGTVSTRYETDRSLADSCPLGLGDAAEEARQNRWYFALFQDSLPHALWLGLQYLRNRHAPRTLPHSPEDG